MNNNIESEKAIEKRLVELTNLNGGLCIKLLSFHLIGLPDRMCIFSKSRIVFVELKTTKQKPRPIQVFMQNKIRKLGFRVEVIDSVYKVDELIESILTE